MSGAAANGEAKRGAAGHGWSIPAVIDIEASGFGRGSYPIEVGAALADGSSHCYLIRPEPDWSHWDHSAEQVHGIGRQTLLSHGHSAAYVAERLNTVLRGRTVYTDGWGVDRSWLALLYDRAGRAQRFTLQSVRALLDEEQVTRWYSVQDSVRAEFALERHRASADARIVQETLVRLGVHVPPG